MPGFTPLFTLQFIGIVLWDIGLSLFNLVTPNLKKGSVVPKGHPGAGGSWPDYVPPKEGDSRGSCPALNALANHGVLPHDGKNIPFTMLTDTVRTSYNFAPTFCKFVPMYCANLLGKKYSTDTVDIADLDLHNGIEHDASLLRQDVYHNKDQGSPHLPFVKALLSSASGKAPDGSVTLTPYDVARFAAKRRMDAQKENPEFSLAFVHKMFGSSNASTLLTILGGRVEDLEPFLVEERLPEGWEPRVMSRMGLTIQTFNGTVLKVESKTKKIIADAER
ncbi:Cloroperoxidase [Hymenopellis radicata]|nr:Cloroperoxidase [Hymenopellis radicata]